jgi:hypothetical protein
MRGRTPAMAPWTCAVIAEEPTALVAHGGVCEGGGPTAAVGHSSTRTNPGVHP